VDRSTGRSQEVFGSFFEEMFEAVSYVDRHSNVLAAFELKEGLESGWNSVWRLL